jgi:CubicO group peptidase (beta-lactamase class C family)
MMDSKHLIAYVQAQSHFSGLVYAVDRQEESEYFRGIEDHRRGTLITHDTAFGIASGTKFLTALAIGMLIDQKRLSLETNVSSILNPKLYQYDKTVQIKHLLSHTSGIPDYLDEELPPNETIENSKLGRVNDYLQYFPLREQDYSPGTRFKYHNGAYVLLALIVEEISQMSYQDFINHHVLKPLRIHNSGVFLASEERPFKAMGYMDRHHRVFHLGAIPEMAGGDGGAYMSAPDFHTLIQAFLNHRVLSIQLTQTFLSQQAVVDESKHLYYGFGLWLKKVKGVLIPFVIGVDAGVRFKCMFHPSNDRFCYFASNTNDDTWALFDMMDELDFGQAFMESA